ncbi:hypothetical protein TNIN_177771 [Trichonephila inaurata madagascariensis]|uniref:Uncharacterized protein n=1 Tax=Trichonephila inaurata madagascariensis TaxID=2747483 RepID=A0A8X6XA09_9ARAC|nr:hypothetical protein TNIN_177771 [Trichonephila inaurata madagascariensis]
MRYVPSASKTPTKYMQQSFTTATHITQWAVEHNTFNFYSKNMHEMRVTELSMRDSISSGSETILPPIMTSPRKSAKALSGTEASRQTAAKCTSPKGFPAWRDTILMRIFKPGASHN